MSKITLPPAPVQLPFPGMPGGIQLAWGLAGLQAGVKAKHEQPADPRQGAFVGFGVMPGARWRERTAKPTGLEKLPAAYLELRRPRRTLEWQPSDLVVRAEIRARSITLATAARWRTGAGIPPWFTGMVPRKLRQLVGLVWTAYRRGAFGLRDTQAAWAAALDCCPRTIRNYVREAVELGLLSAVQLWTEKDGETWRDIVLLRPGWALESLAGLAAFEFSKGAPVQVRASFPGESRTVEATRSAAADRARALCDAASHFHADQRHRHYQARAGKLRAPMLPSSPALFAEYLEAVLREDLVEDLVEDLAPAGAAVAPRRECPSGGRPSDATGDPSSPPPPKGNPTTISPQRKKLPNRHTSLPPVGPLGVPDSCGVRDLTEKEFSPVASDGRPPDGHSLRGATAAPASTTTNRATAPPQPPERAGAAPGDARGEPSPFAGMLGELLEAGHWTGNEADDG